MITEFQYMIAELQYKFIAWFNSLEYYDDIFGEILIEIITCVPWVVLVFLALLPLRFLIDLLFGGIDL